MIMTSGGFSVLRNSFGKLTQSQVDGINRLIAASKSGGLTYAETSYLLATAYHETGSKMQPITEYGSIKYFDKYDVGVLAKRLGNTPEKDGDGYLYRGRGDVQITGTDNYKKFSNILKVDLLNNPDLALNPEISAKIIVIGMRDGLFTNMGFRKNRPVNKYDKESYIRARAIVNGSDKASLIAGYALIFEKALRSF